MVITILLYVGVVLLPWVLIGLTVSLMGEVKAIPPRW